MIETEKIYYLKCDKCGAYLTHTHNNDAIEFYDEIEAEWQAEQQNWTVKPYNEHYCPACQEELETERTYED